MKTSVALCTYNGEKFLKEQIESILHQTIKVDEIIVCDDGSTDQTTSILSEYQKKFPELFKIQINETNLRSVKNFEKAVSLCSHDIIFLSDQDDVWVGNKVEKYLEYFSEHPEISVLCSNGYGINEKSEILDVFPIWEVPELLRQKGTPMNYFDYITFIGNIATGASMAIRKTFVKDILPFPSVKGFHHDEWIALIASSQNKFEILNEKYFKYRVHDKQQVGGVFYPNTEKRKKRMISMHTMDPDIKDFAFYKSALKRLSGSYQKNKMLAANADAWNDIFENNAERAKALFIENKKQFREKFPLGFFMLSITDKIKGKRQL
ncbi:glycosyltransferase involved in cell wall biosynthesis [Chryseobacterium defluvii]|uniref:Glycosyltransferase involved in cell wall biosynthesis n=1 Tax=Chryseobacterium defluvii TaxID=160396 RepID=A0A840KIY4_9FLAO|nr:glycosyltransferase family 2 protein [Chryseobacterium defluvii]MBB4807644.1 glycosyltransferase involved in cell wall biosynthesis [Chryseobacterium defluvii]